MTRPKREWKVGDRVRVYPHGGRSPFKAKIYGIVPRPDAGTTDVFLIEDGFYSAHAECPFHAKQLRRLVPRKRREWLLHGLPDGTIHVSQGVSLRGGETVLVIEAPRRGRR